MCTGCLCTLFERCAGTGAGADPDQVLGALQRLAPCLQLPPATASEEIRASSFRAVSLLLLPAAKSHTICQGSKRPDGLTLEELMTMDLESLIISTFEEATHLGAGLIPSPHAYARMPPGAEAARVLAGKDTAPLVGFLIHASISAAEQEVLPAKPEHAPASAAQRAAAGLCGSRAVQLAALDALRTVMAAVGTPSGLAFFLPGIVSGLSKQLLVASKCNKACHRHVHASWELDLKPCHDAPQVGSTPSP